MNTYLLLKWLHVLSSTILFGTGIGIAFFKWSTDRSRDVRAIRLVNERTVLADWIFTTPAVIIQPITGIGLIYVGGYPWNSGWILLATVLYLVAGACWLPVVWLQLQMRTMSIQADVEQVPLPRQYWHYAKIWFWLGIPAFAAIVVVYLLMVLKPML